MLNEICSSTGNHFQRQASAQSFRSETNDRCFHFLAIWCTSTSTISRLSPIYAFPICTEIASTNGFSVRMSTLRARRAWVLLIAYFRLAQSIVRRSSYSYSSLSIGSPSCSSCQPAFLYAFTLRLSFAPALPCVAPAFRPITTLPPISCTRTTSLFSRFGTVGGLLRLICLVVILAHALHALSQLARLSFDPHLDVRLARSFFQLCGCIWTMCVVIHRFLMTV